MCRFSIAQRDRPLVVLVPSVLSSHSLPPFGALPSDMDSSALRNRTITISVITGPLKGHAYQLTKASTSIGQTGGGADIEIDDPQVSALHCVVGVTHDTVRLCDLNSANGTYVDGERVQDAKLGHLTEFCLGSTWLMVTIVPKHFNENENSEL